MRVLSAADLRAAVPMRAAIEAMRTAFAQKARGLAQVPPRTVLQTHAGHALFMPAWLAGSQDLCCKIVSVVPANPSRDLPRIIGLVSVFDPETGEPVALLHGATVTSLRTAAVTGLATELLSRPDACVLALLGAGALAADQLAAVAAVRSLREVRIYAPTAAHAEAVARTWPGARAVRDAASALRGADLVVTATSSSTPVFDPWDLAPGAHINAVGAWRPEMQEIPAEILARATLFVDDREAAWSESGDLVQAAASGHLHLDAPCTELGALVTGAAPGRTHTEEITLFESVGLALEDAALAGVALAEARRRGLGAEVAL